MQKVIAAFYREPVVFLGVVQAAVTAAALKDLIAGWIAFVVVASIVPLQRRFVTPDPSK
jgi:hypothetical protein